MAVYGSLNVEFGDYQLMTQPDIVAISDPQASQIRWTDCVHELASAIDMCAATLVVVAGHQGIFRDYLDVIARTKPEVRIREAEAAIVSQMRAPKPRLYVTGFHHVDDSEIHRILRRVKELAYPGTFGRVRAIVEEGGGPAGRLSVLKHELMRPLASVRLLLQLEDESGGRAIDASLAARISTAIRDGRRRLDEANQYCEPTEDFAQALGGVSALFDTDVARITSDPRSFNVWIDELNEALDKVRQEAR
jgi:hypothetical protein